MELPAPPPPGAPGPFAFADPERVRAILGGAGFGGALLSPLTGNLAIGAGGDLERAVVFAMQMGPAAVVLREASLAVRERARDAIRAALAPLVTPTGVRADYAAWVVTARNGD